MKFTFKVQNVTFEKIRKETQMRVIVENIRILIEIKKSGGAYDKLNVGHVELACT